ncbi:MAG: hypothetical protein UX49_C0044G0006 [Candidatus Wolfebacteria bacterium GW2011_GWC2_46_275]|uniref:Uncharacterized protein n=2 Tax=Candidatus Wolfeibacteriota TaxID=1752735 RepID=A0A0G1U6X0_9BACT|nr:MAG: hypothetical protein UX70_C0001G0954 [Candidatus Wolfebacteria bacterium GW2011_GWB1_47_1]KKU34493.1 MAG: hypothetical protein UX49_C0044G0006 [Candidatus Wolfebacteria bacterium GW2011_GWC2_46_275]KKU42233.1 MAG: hypothetical protein UX58_C0003G0158 [Candidatus Wolfebacteria bacterium GW2011_GWB2_46_69]KKU53203.1 MAG: hypothetical protein UX76_C0020G0002 [Candidatus Wolfebacteria bacterium GW2011_GWC1_47_103]KKU59419.1 MAG: hypothetical protein UX83_C0005G0038 [Candidatus Wolfebacteria
MRKIEIQGQDSSLDYSCSNCHKVHNFKLPDEEGVPKLCDVCARAEEARIEVALYKSFTQEQKDLFTRVSAIREYIQAYAILST